MCSRPSNLGLAIPATALDRRSFLKGAALGTIRMAVAGGMAGPSRSAQAAGTLHATHGSGFCNVAFFISHARQLARDDGVTLEFISTPSFADEVTFLAAGHADVSMLPYTNFIGTARCCWNPPASCSPSAGSR